MQEASLIRLTALEDQAENLATMLTGAADLIQQTEPQTRLWAALRAEKHMLVFDGFEDDIGRQRHFAGQAASVLQQEAENLVEGGWVSGVITNIRNPKIVSHKVLPDFSTANIGVWISLEALPDKAETVKAFLMNAAETVQRTEPKTLYWFALQFDETHFGILDFFAEESGVEAHFAGEVAKAVKENADALLVGGWEDGVVANIEQFEVLAMTVK